MVAGGHEVTHIAEHGRDCKLEDVRMLDGAKNSIPRKGLKTRRTSQQHWPVMICCTLLM